MVPTSGDVLMSNDVGSTVDGCCCRTGAVRRSTMPLAPTGDVMYVRLGSQHVGANEKAGTPSSDSPLMSLYTRVTVDDAI
jgi:hypothetical protein